MSDTQKDAARATAVFGRGLAKALMVVPILIYRWTLSPFVGFHCRHLPSCSDYAREAIEKNGAWKGGWLAFARLCRCHPWGSHGFDPVPHLMAEHHPFAPWRYGRWRLAEASRSDRRRGNVVP
ncbi:MAG: membrane protein insertion efficiency factor YidD [Methyloceanibacter sp.]